MSRYYIRRTQTVNRFRAFGIFFFILSFLALSGSVFSAILIDGGLIPRLWWDLCLASGLLTSVAALFCFAVSSDL